jgi:hypothetical protein
MKRFLVAIFTLLPLAALCSPNPCKFGGVDEAHYRIGEAFTAADVVVEGKITAKAANGSDLSFEIYNTYKGEAAKEITLNGQRPLNTEMNGFTLPVGHEFLLLLKAPLTGAYVATEDFNSGCPVAFEITDGKAVFTDSVKVPLGDLKDYLSRSKDFSSSLK